MLHVHMCNHVTLAVPRPLHWIVISQLSLSSAQWFPSECWWHHSYCCLYTMSFRVLLSLPLSKILLPRVIGNGRHSDQHQILLHAGQARKKKKTYVSSAKGQYPGTSISISFLMSSISSRTWQLVYQPSLSLKYSQVKNKREGLGARLTIILLCISLIEWQEPWIYSESVTINSQ